MRLTVSFSSAYRLSLAQSLCCSWKDGGMTRAGGEEGEEKEETQGTTDCADWSYQVRDVFSPLILFRHQPVHSTDLCDSSALVG
jgi:hypothetical protein